MQARGVTSICTPRACVALLAICILALVGCGGGTTGTSSGDTFKLVGITESSQRAPLPDTSMSVLSGANDQVLVESQTDRSGDFEMDLPSDEESLIVDVQGTKSAPLKRQLRGEGVVSTKLRQDSAGALSFAETFEVQIDTASLCPALIAEGNQLYQRAEWSQGPKQSCSVRFMVRSKDLPTASLEVTGKSNCDVTIQSSSAEPDGTLSVDVADLLNSGCRSAELVVSANGSALLSATFPLSLMP